MEVTTTERARALSRSLPLPIADAVSAWVAAESLHERRDRVVECFRATVRYLAAVALSARVQFGAGPDGESAQVIDLMRSLRKRGLTDGQWVGLLRHLLGAWAKQCDAHAVPALARLFTGKSKKFLSKAIDGLLEMRKAETVAHGATGTPAAIQRVLDRREPQLVDLLTRLDPVWQSAQLIVPLARPQQSDAQKAWSLVGDTPGRGRWPHFPLRPGVELEPGAPTLISSDGVPLVSLDPVAMFRRPSPDATEELFLLDGAKRNAAVFVSFPSMAELREKKVWDTLGKRLFDGDDVEDPPPASGGIKRPYRGLSSFSSKHAALFFGRERLVETVANRVRRHPMVTVTGPSGSGKSSLLLAGVVPVLDHLTAVVLRPGARPRAMLARRLAEALKTDEDALVELLMDRPETLGSFLEAQVRNARPALLLIIDQAEEMFTLCDRDDERLGFSDALASAGLDANGATRVVLSLREDYFARLSTLPPLRGQYSRHVEVVATPDREDLFRVLMLPAQAFGFSFEDEQLIDEMLTSVEDEPAALAMLQFCADQMWERRDRKWKRLTRDAYRAVGGVAGALATHADSVLDAMTRPERGRARGVLLRCVTEDGTRAVTAIHEIAEAIGDGAIDVIEALVEARLLTTQQTDDDGTQTVELVHEALLAHWERLRGWLADDDHLLRIRARVGQAATRWHQDGEPKDRLLGDGKPLIEATELLSRHREWLRPAEVEFIEASRARSIRGRKLRRLAIGGLVVLTVLAAGFGGVAWWARGRAQTMQTLAESNERAATERTVQLIEEQGRRELFNGKPTRAAMFLVDAVRRGGDGTALRSMLADAMRPIDGHRASWPAQTSKDESVGSIHFSPDGRRLLSVDRHGRWCLWNASDQRKVASERLGAEGESLTSVAFLNSGEFVLASDRGLVARFDTSGKKRWHGRHNEKIVGLVVTDEGIISASRDGELRRWAPDTGEVLATRTHVGIVRSLAADPRGDRVGIGAEDGSFSIYDWEAWQVVRTVEGVGPVTRSQRVGGAWVSLSSRRRTFIEPQDSPLGYHTEVPALGVVSIIDATSLTLRARLESHSRVSSWSASSDANNLALIGFPNDIELWNATSRKVVHTWPGHGRYARPGQASAPTTRQIVHDESGRYLASRGSDETVTIWDAETGGQMSSLRHRGQATAMAWSADGKQLATADKHQNGTTLHLWDLRTKRLATLVEPATLLGDTLYTLNGDGEATSYAYTDAGLSPDPSPVPPHGPWRVTADVDGKHMLWLGPRTLLVWRADGSELARLEPFAQRRAAFFAGAFHASTERVLVGSVKGGVELWSIRGERLLDLKGHEPIHKIMHLGFSRGGERVVAAVRGKAIIWNAHDGRKLLQTDEPTDGFSLSPKAFLLGDGARLLDMTSALKGRMWDVNEKRILFSMDATEIVVSSDHTTLLAIQDGSPVGSLHDASTGALLRNFEGHEDQLTTAALSVDGLRAFTGAKDGTIRVWDTTTGACLARMPAHRGGVRSLQPQGPRLVSTGSNGSALWDTGVDTRTAAELGERLDAVAPWQWVDERLVPKR